MSGPVDGSVSADAPGMVKAQSKLQETYGELNGAMQDLQEQQSTLAANWSGEAQTMFGQALENFVEDFVKILNALAGMMETLSANTGIYVNTADRTQALAGDFIKTTGGSQVPVLPGF